MACKALPSPEVLRQLLRYEPESGKLFWRRRSPVWFTDGKNTAEQKCRRWNALYDGKQAFSSVDTRGYLIGTLLSEVYKAHRVIWVMNTGEDPLEFIDHKDRDPMNNRMENLRLASRSENGRNINSRRGTTSQFLGVCWSKPTRKWMASITVSGRKKNLGYFASEIAAARAYDDAARCYHGEFANPNIPEQANV